MGGPKSQQAGDRFQGSQENQAGSGRGSVLNSLDVFANGWLSWAGAKPLARLYLAHCNIRKLPSMELEYGDGKISPKFQVVIPKRLRNALNLSAGQKVQMVVYEGRIELIPLREISEMKGFLKGIDITFERESDRI